MENIERSIAFISHHKCATSYISTKILPNVNGYEYVDYQTCAYNEQITSPKVHSKGHVYGVLRMLEKEHPLYAMTESLISDSLDKSLKIIIMVRDPRDVIVSMYYSFGKTHGLSPNDIIAQYQRERKDRIVPLSIDEYASASSSTLYEIYNRLMSISDVAEDVCVIRYEDMIENFDGFYKTLLGTLPEIEVDYDEFHSSTRPKDIEDIHRHKRSGRVNSYKDKLSSDTIKYLNSELSSILSFFKYA